MPRRLAALALAATALSQLVACGGDSDPASRIVSLRVLAVHADKPYAKPGETVSLDTLWWDGLDPDQKTRPRQWAWTTCVNPSGSTVVDCLAKIVTDAQKTGKPPPFTLSQPGVDAPTFTLTVPDDAITSLPEAARVYAEVGVVLIVCPGTLQLPDPSAGYTPGVFPIQCIDSTGRSLGLDEFEAGLKRVFVRATTPNSNPVIESITWDGTPWAEGDVKTVTACETDGNRFDQCDASLAHELATNVTKESFESGTDEFGAAYDEQLVAQYYATEGLFEYDVKVAKEPKTRWVARSKAKGQTLHLWFVARDNRGGVTWQERLVQVQ